jgi:hypothetical protein
MMWKARLLNGGKKTRENGSWDCHNLKYILWKTTYRNSVILVGAS